MVKSGPTLLAPLIWPLGHVSAAIRKDENEKPEKPYVNPLMDISGHCMAFLASARSWMMAYACMYYLPEKCGLEAYPGFGPGRVYSLDWVSHILIRNIVGTWIICGFWDWFLYFSPLKDKLHKYKMNPVYPSMQQIKHDAFWTTTASLCGSLIEIILCHHWALGTMKIQNSLSVSPILTFILALTVTHYRIPHFYLVHRMMHPWKTTTVPDFGKFLYKKVHSLHHKSYNPTAWSGTNMHPVEATLYYSAVLIPVALSLHPVHALAVLIDCGVGAWLGHDGFQWPGSGDYFHLLHHAHFDCNYGAMHVPLDLLFGTFAGSKEEVKQIWSNKPSGEENNTTPVHAASKQADKVM
ncbi:putative Delta(7)-sterol-C5(6)-desaturase 2 [Eurytemora carolleeae]|uniref:putative Delta(7)-sterol-C5(6)-desaturase 2 n=1 Tax=Eurytemora carolleeae TaxID=1294199 RepID=UPI000C765E55|nr:putative Delta(7)-sterol-C5(6)-desaturase 2 [Eurytemora carolleeae]|eukprot:XP_023337634.1 putative Delta(7)-sterol-C5(6)-desaturase 2 [Eurytemora affinis]